MGKNLPANAGDGASIPGSGRSPGGGHGSSLRYSSHGWHSWALLALISGQRGAEQRRAERSKLIRPALGKVPWEELQNCSLPAPQEPGCCWVPGAPLSSPEDPVTLILVTIGEGRVSPAILLRNTVTWVEDCLLVYW